MSDLPYPPDPGKSCHHECWRSRGHHNCAVRKVEQLQAELAPLRAAVDAMANDRRRDSALIGGRDGS